MKNDLDELKENERQLDSLIEKIKISSKRQNECKQAYVTYQDLHNIDKNNDQMIMVVKSPPETQLILMEGDPPPIVLKSEKDEINIFFCPDPTSGGLQATSISSDTDDEEASTSIRQHRKSASSTTNKRKGVGSAQRNLMKDFDDMSSEPKSGKAKNNLFSKFNATVYREPKENKETAKTSTKSHSIITKDLMLENDPHSEELESSFAVKKDVKFSLFSPQKSFQINGDGSWADTISGMESFSPGFSFSNSDDPTGGFFPLEPDAGYNFLLAESEGIMDLFDYKI